MPFSKEQAVNSELIFVVAVGLGVIGVVWLLTFVIGNTIGEFKRKAMYREFERLVNQRPAAAVAYQTLDNETRAILRQMGENEITLVFNA
jgi:hypothetical protein